MSIQEYTQALQSKYNKMLLSKAETAQELNVSEATLDRMRKQGTIQSKKVSGQIFFSIGTVATFVAS